MELCYKVKVKHRTETSMDDMIKKWLDARVGMYSERKEMLSIWFHPKQPSGNDLFLGISIIS